MTTIIDAPATSRRSLLARNGTVELWSDTRGDGPTAVVLLADAGCQAIQWEPAFTDPVVAAGHRVVRFDWRDVGRSSWLAPDDRTPTPFDMDHRRAARPRSPAASPTRWAGRSSRKKPSSPPSGPHCP
jgi:pimeloyl-ACP methyl ester carboxylesterase